LRRVMVRVRGVIPVPPELGAAGPCLNGAATCHAAGMPRTPAPDRFDAAFYRRFYRDPRTRVATRTEFRLRARLIGAFLRHTRLPVRSILDAGCGLGYFREPLLAEWPRARYTGLEVSEYLCRRYGWVQGSLAEFGPDERYDLVVCHDVLQYLGAREAAAALRNLGELCRGVLHFNALTEEDWRLHCDRRTTDRDVHLRPAAWYRRRLRRDFVDAGSCLFVHRSAPVHLWELERLG